MPTVIITLLSFLLSFLSPALPASNWPIEPALNQYSTPDCTGYAFATWLQTGPGEHYHLSGSYLYDQAKLIDNYAGLGTPPSAVAQVVERLGYMESIRFTPVVTDALRYLATAPILVEAAWYAGMSSPVHGVATPTGPQENYHEFMCYGYDPRTHMVACENSWGPNWGIDGHFYISSDDLQAVAYDLAFGLPVKSPPRGAPGNRMRIF